MFKRFTAILAFVLATIGLSTTAHARSDEVMGFITWDAEAAQAAINNGEQVVVTSGPNGARRASPSAAPCIQCCSRTPMPLPT